MYKSTILPFLVLAGCAKYLFQINENRLITYFFCFFFILVELLPFLAVYIYVESLNTLRIFGFISTLELIL